MHYVDDNHWLCEAQGKEWDNAPCVPVWMTFPQHSSRASPL